ncbi:MAG: hypothetical protein ACRD8U_10585 [Pyrinomonadaceae bacterium]
MTRIFRGPVELSETPTPNHEPLFIGATLRFEFQVTEVTADPNQGNFPTVKIGTLRVQTFQEWQQHEVRMNGYLIGTIDKSSAGPQEFRFAFQLRVLKVDESNHQPHELPLDLVNTLVIQLGEGGFGLNDSFDIEYVDFEGFTTNFP